jgi:urea transport system ATP-binding protein
MSVLAINSLNQFYGGSHTLWDVNLSVSPGARMCLMGRNGMGKTTLLKCMMGLQAISSDGMSFDGSDLVKCDAEQRQSLASVTCRKGVKFFSELTVEENLPIGLGVRKNGPRTIPSRIFDLFPVLKKMLNRRGGDLSGGQQQLAIGRVLVLEPKLLILDEPTEGIQPNVVHEIGDMIHEAEQGRAYSAAGRAEAAFCPSSRERVLHSRQRPPCRCRSYRRTYGRGGALASERVNLSD